MKKQLKSFLETITNRRKLWIWITWTFFKNEFLDHNRELVGENLNFGKLLQRKETVRILLELKKEYKDVIHGHVAISAINDLLDILNKVKLGKDE
jgi:hypothetical protein